MNRLVTKNKRGSPAKVVTLDLQIEMPCLIHPHHAFTGVPGIRIFICFYSSVYPEW